MNPESYTLEEARRELARRDCAFNGHSWDVMETMARPVAIVCSRCGEQLPVGEAREKKEKSNPESEAA